MMAIRSGLACVVVVLGCPSSLIPAGAGDGAARDLHALSRLLEPAYTAMSYANLCSMNREWAVSQPTGSRGTVINYAEHVKDEVIASLYYEEAVAVLKSAAEAARNEARRQLRENVVVTDKTEEAIRFGRWCGGYVNTFIRALMRAHDGSHPALLIRIDPARSRTEPPENDR